MTGGANVVARLWRAGLAAAVLVSVLSMSAATSGALPPASRLSGSDRFGTAAAISAATYSPGVPVAVVVTGRSFPDAVAAAPAATKLGGPVLLTEPDALPSATASELDRLDPARIIVVGGTTSISSAVQTGLGKYTAGPVERVEGPDRYATAAALSKRSFAASADVVFVASGADFPDALAGAPAAGAVGAPMLLVPAQGQLPSSTATELGRLAAKRIVVLGGPATVSDATVGQLGAHSAQPVARRAGADRYATAVEISKAAFPASSTAYLATGRSFPDALAGGALGGKVKAPVLLVDTTCIPPVVNAEITRLAPAGVVLLGGTTTLGAGVEAGTVCTPPRVTFGEGDHVVGAGGIAPGTYRTRTASGSCYWERLRGFSGTIGDIIANGLSDFVQVVTIKPGDAGFSSDGCGTWTNDLSALRTNRGAPLGSGTYLVGVDLTPGTWSAAGGDDCYWERLRGFGGELADIIANDVGTSFPIVTISTSDAGFASDGCGTWTRAS